MAGSAQWAVGTTPVLIASAGPAATVGPTGWFYIVNSPTTAVYLGGGTSVTSTTGASLATSGTVSGFLFPGDTLYAVTASSTSTVSVLQMGA